MTLSRAVILLAASLLLATPAAAQQRAPVGDGSVLFGVQNVDFGTRPDRDVIAVGPAVGKFDKVRLSALDQEIQLVSLKVVYSNGEPDFVKVGQVIGVGGSTEWIPLKGDRFVKEVELVYHKRADAQGLARVALYGHYAKDWLSPQGEGRKHNDGWVLLGARTAGFFGFDRDVVPVGTNAGGFRRLRISVRDRAITLRRLTVVYADGVPETITFGRREVKAGSLTEPVELSGKGPIVEIRAVYRSRITDKAARGKGAATVEIWGQH